MNKNEIALQPSAGYFTKQGPISPDRAIAGKVAENSPSPSREAKIYLQQCDIIAEEAKKEVMANMNNNSLKTGTQKSAQGSLLNSAANRLGSKS